MFVILAPPNVGKSLTMNSFTSCAINHKRKVVYYTLEMSADEVSWRLIRNLASVTKEELMMGGQLAYERIKAIEKKVTQDLILNPDGSKSISVVNRDIIIKHYTSNSCGINTIYSHLTLLETQGFVPDIVFVDYADLMTPPRKYSEKRAELSAIYNGLRDLAVEKNVALVTASQTNRGVYQKDLATAADIAEDFGKVAIADIMITLNQSPTERTDGKIRLYITKNRTGKTNEKISTYINYDYMLMGDISVDHQDVLTALEAPRQ
jgi:replicative DNA helicase